MAFDGLFCSAVAAELNSWAGGRVEKLYQSSPSCICIQLYAAGKHMNLIISASASRPILACTDSAAAKPDTPTPTCMLYRKHLQNGRLSGVEWIKNERIVRFDFDSADEMGYVHRKSIYAEMMGKYSNLILTEGNGRIINAASVSDITSSVRSLLPGMLYETPPAQDKKDIAATDAAAFAAVCAAYEGARAADMLLRSFCGLSPLVARELAFRALGDCDALVSAAAVPLLWAEFDSLRNLLAGGKFTPCAVFSPEGKETEYSFFPIKQYGEGFEVKEYGSFSELLTDYFGRREESVNIGRYSHDTLHAVNTHLAKLRKKLALLESELSECNTREEARLCGDIVTANIWRIRRGDESVTGTDYETGEEKTVRLDPTRTPAENAQKYYNKYAKMKRAAEAKRLQIEKALAEQDYLEGVAGFIERAAEPAEIAEIRDELSAGGYLGKPANRGAKPKKTKAASPLSFRTADGRLVRVGRNNRQNDSLTAGAEKNDIWFHIKGFHGSHVILSGAGGEPTDGDYTAAAMLAAYYSEKRGASNVGVDYTRVRHLKKPGGSAPGFVTYEKYFTAYVNAEMPALEGRVR